MVDIETEWNLKPNPADSLSRNPIVDIETEWNLKEKMFMELPVLDIVDIETEWNLKFKARSASNTLWRRYRNRMEFKENILFWFFVAHLCRYRNRMEFKGRIVCTNSVNRAR